MSVKRHIGKLLQRILPQQAYRAVEMRSSRRHAIRWLRQNGVLDLALKVADRFEYTVQDGPFRGMRYTQAAVLTRHSIPTLLGTYERQLYPFLIEAARRSEMIIDIGSAEGYFAVGLARLTGKRVIAFDADPGERQTIRGMAVLNQVSDLLTVSQWCSSERLVELVHDRRALVFCDIEGGEFSLFTPDVIEALKGCDVIIELHGTQAENSIFVQRFRGRSGTVLEHPQQVASVERIAFLGREAARTATEYRGFQQWLVLKPGDVSSLEQLRMSLQEANVSVHPDHAEARLTKT